MEGFITLALMIDGWAHFTKAGYANERDFLKGHRGGAPTLWKNDRHGKTRVAEALLRDRRV
jgi:hypothetical protein